MASIESFENLLASGQDNALLRYSLGSEYLKAGDHEQAIAQLRKAIEHDPRYSAAWKLYGKALAAAGCHGEAIAVFDQGMQVAEEKGDIQAAKEMAVFRKRSQKALLNPSG